MRAARSTRYGGPEVIEVAEVAKPVPGPGEVLIRVHATEVTKADCELRSFRFPVKWFWLPLRLAFGLRRPRRKILGSYFAGEVVATGDDKYGIAAQSVGGGGGAGGVNVSGGILYDKPKAQNSTEPTLVFGMGGNGGAGNSSGDVSVSSG